MALPQVGMARRRLVISHLARMLCLSRNAEAPITKIADHGVSAGEQGRIVRLAWGRERQLRAGELPRAVIPLSAHRERFYGVDSAIAMRWSVFSR